MAAVAEKLAIAQRIARAMPALSESHRKIAEYVLAHPLQAATLPIDELAATVGVSVATANRFARALAFDGYPQFRAALVMGFGPALAPVERLRSKLERPATAADVFAAALENVRSNIELSRQLMDSDVCDRAIAAILGARRVYIIGFGASSWLGGLLQRWLDPYRDNVHLLASIENSSYAARMLTRLTPEDLLIAIAYPRYYGDTVLLARRAHAAGIPLLALTDRENSPLVPLATVTLLAHTDSPYFANSEASVLALIEALCSAVAHQAKDSVKSAARLAEAVLPWLHGQPSDRTRAAAPIVATSTRAVRPRAGAQRKNR
jgi:DNA-binding MurR/RpiR family transcriptional regulator